MAELGASKGRRWWLTTARENREREGENGVGDEKKRALLRIVLRVRRATEYAIAVRVLSLSPSEFVPLCLGSAMKKAKAQGVYALTRAEGDA